MDKKKYPKTIAKFSVGGMETIIQARESGRVRVNFRVKNEELTPGWGFTFKDWRRFGQFIDYLREVEEKFWIEYIERFPVEGTGKTLKEVIGNEER